VKPIPVDGGAAFLARSESTSGYERARASSQRRRYSSAWASGVSQKGARPNRRSCRVSRPVRRRSAATVDEPSNEVPHGIEPRNWRGRAASDTTRPAIHELGGAPGNQATVPARFTVEHGVTANVGETSPGFIEDQLRCRQSQSRTSTSLKNRSAEPRPPGQILRPNAAAFDVPG